MSELSDATLRISASIEAVQRAIGLELLPVIERLGAVMRQWYYSLPGMPYTAPSLWDGEQMAADR